MTHTSTKTRKLKPHETVRLGDLVTVGADERQGYRKFTGHLGTAAGDLSYPLYRQYPVQAELKSVSDLRQWIENLADDTPILGQNGNGLCLTFDDGRLVLGQ